MTTEQYILDNCACGRVRMAARAVTRRYDDALRPSGLRATQFAVLVAVSVDGAISIASLAKQLGMDRSTLTRNLGPMVKEGLIAVGLEGWRRSRTLEITKAGRARMRDALPLWEGAQEALRRHLGAKNWQSAHEGLGHLIRTG